MAEKKTIERARQKAHEGKSPATQAGEFVKEEIEHIRKGKHGARSAKQVIAIGLSKARKAGIPLPPRAGQKAKGPGRKKRKPQSHPSARRSRAIFGVLRREPRRAASSRALSAQTRGAAKRRGPQALHRAALKAVRTKGPRVLREAGRKAARSRKAA